MIERFDPTLLPCSPDLSLEAPLWSAEVAFVAGIDEVGRGALAGPVTAAALVLPRDPTVISILKGVRDSKELTPFQRAECAERLRQVAVCWGIGHASPAEIDTLGIVQATRLAMQRALDLLAPSPEHLLLDYLCLPECPLPQTSLIKGDARSLSIAGASILAKTARDALMCELDLQYPGYGFAGHKGYCTRDHLCALERLGPCPSHRSSFAPVAILRAEANTEPVDIPQIAACLSKKTEGSAASRTASQAGC
jgi:ribonuclease HII